MKFRKKSKIVDVEELDITSLLDILVILLVFLLQSFNSSDLTVNLAEQLALPLSTSQNFGNLGPILQVNANLDVWLDDDRVGKVGELTDSKNKLVNILTKKAEEIRKNVPEKDKKKDDVLFINLLFDKGLNYAIIDQVLKKCAESGFGKYKFIVQGNE